MLELIVANTLMFQEEEISPQSVVEAFEESCLDDNGALWGVSLCGPILLVDRDNMVVFTNSNQGEGDWKALSPGIWSMSYEAENAPVQANTAAEWNGVEWAVVQLNSNSLENYRRLTLHESFHRIQSELDYSSMGNDPGNGHLDDVQARIFLRLQIRALAAALVEDDLDLAHAHFHNAIKYAQLRHQFYEGSAQSEFQLEQNEGYAEYTAWRLADQDNVYQRAADNLLANENADSFSRSFAYQTGLGLGLVMDRLDMNWRELVMTTDKSLIDIATSLLMDRNYPDESVLGEVPYDNESLAQDEIDRGEATQARREAYMARFVDGPRLFLPLGQMNFNPNTAFSLGEHGQIYGTAALSGPWGSVETDTGILFDWNNGRAVVDAKGEPEIGEMSNEDWTMTVNEGWFWQVDGPDWRLVEVEESTD